MIQGSLTEKIFGPELKLNMFERVAYSIAISVDDNIISKIFKTNRNKNMLSSTNVAYIDKSIFPHEKNRKFFVEKIRVELQGKGVIVFDLDSYLYLKTLSGKPQIGLKNSLFPYNLYNDFKNIKEEYVIIFFDPDILGDPKFDEFASGIYPKTERICINECREYSLLEMAYIKGLFSDIKQMKRI